MQTSSKYPLPPTRKIHSQLSAFPRLHSLHHHLLKLRWHLKNKPWERASFFQNHSRSPSATLWWFGCWNWDSATSQHQGRWPGESQEVEASPWMAVDEGSGLRGPALQMLTSPLLWLWFCHLAIWSSQLILIDSQGWENWHLTPAPRDAQCSDGFVGAFLQRLENARELVICTVVLGDLRKWKRVSVLTLRVK